MGLSMMKGVLGVLEIVVCGVVMVMTDSVVVKGCLITTGGLVW